MLDFKDLIVAIRVSASEINSSTAGGMLNLSKLPPLTQTRVEMVRAEFSGKCRDTHMLEVFDDYLTALIVEIAETGEPGETLVQLREFVVDCCVTTQKANERVKLEALISNIIDGVNIKNLLYIQG